MSKNVLKFISIYMTVYLFYEQMSDENSGMNNMWPCTPKHLSNSVTELIKIIVRQKQILESFGALFPPEHFPMADLSPEIVKNMDIDVLRSNATLWCAYERGWRDHTAASAIPPPPHEPLPIQLQLAQRVPQAPQVSSELSITSGQSSTPALSAPRILIENRGRTAPYRIIRRNNNIPIINNVVQPLPSIRFTQIIQPPTPAITNEDEFESCLNDLSPII